MRKPCISQPENLSKWLLRHELKTGHYLAISAMLSKFDAVQIETGANPGDFNRWRVETRFGPLVITYWTDENNLVYSPFQGKNPCSLPNYSDNFPAKDDLNKFSGKWNCAVTKNGKLDFDEAIKELRNRLSQIAIYKTL